MDNAELDGVVLKSGDVHSNDNHIEMKREERITGIENIAKRVQLIDGWCGAISGGEAGNDERITNSAEDGLVSIMREKAFDELKKEELDSKGMSHLEILAKKQDKELEAYPTVDSESSDDDKLEFIKVLVGNINKVHNNNSLGITPKMSRELNCMDCSMSTWVMIHEANKKRIDIEFGAPVGHAIGIVRFGDKTYYADGQKGFVVEIKTIETVLSGGSNVLQIQNYEDIQREKKYGEFFPEFVFVDKGGGVSSTMSNLDSMLFVNKDVTYLSEKSRYCTADEIKTYFADQADKEVKALEEDAGKQLIENIRRRYEQDSKTYTSLLPYIVKYNEQLSSFVRKEKRSKLSRGEKRDKGIDPADEMVLVMEELFPDLEEFRYSDKYWNDVERLDYLRKNNN